MKCKYCERTPEQVLEQDHELEINYGEEFICRYCKDIRETEPFARYVRENEMLTEKLAAKERELEVLKNIKAKEVGEALTTVAKYLGDIISQKLDTATILDIAKYCETYRKLLAISKLENVLLITDHVCNSPDNEIPDMVEQLRKYIRSEIAELEGEQNERN